MRKIRVTSVPRQNSPNAGFHPLSISENTNEIIFVIPGRDTPLLVNNRCKYFLVERLRLVSFLSLRACRLISLIELFLYSIWHRKSEFIVHSFVYSIPLYFSKAKYMIVSHGSDRVYFEYPILSPIVKAAKRIGGVGFSFEVDGAVVEEIPNVFRDFGPSLAVKDYLYDVIFILREADVKNPTYPLKLFRETAGENLRIAVVGLSKSFLCNEDLEYILSERTDDRKIDYLGKLSQGEVKVLLQRSYVFVCPSKREGVAKALLEALSCGAHAVVSSKLELPDPFLDFVHRTNIADSAGVLKLVSELKLAGVNNAGVRFSKSYLYASRQQLMAFYNSYWNGDY